jgi:hypothetical protein
MSETVRVFRKECIVNGFVKLRVDLRCTGKMQEER